MNSLKISNLIELKALYKLGIYPIQREGIVETFDNSIDTIEMFFNSNFYFDKNQFKLLILIISSRWSL